MALSEPVEAPRARGPASARLLLLLSFCACTELEPGSDRLQQGLGMSREADAAVADPRWACLDEAPPGDAARVVPSVVLSLFITDIISGVPPVGLEAHACAKADVLCATPLTPGFAVEDDGGVHLSVPRGFDGFVEIRSSDSVPTMFFLNRELTRDASEALTVASPAGLGALASQGNVFLDPELGHLLVRTFDCLGEPAAGVRISNDAGGTAFAFVAGLPNLNQDVTTTDGLGGFINVPIGYAVLEGRRVDGDRLLGSASVVVRAGWFTYGDVEPRPQ